MICQKVSNLRFRYDKFGGLAWTPKGYIYQLTFNEVALLDILNVSRSISEINSYFVGENLHNICQSLIKKKLIIPSSTAHSDGILDAYVRAKVSIEKAKKQHINKPFWVHLQPFTFCNLNCIHCYCSGGTKQSELQLSIYQWESIVDKLVKFGVLEIYVTGGENLILSEYFELTEYILSQGCSTGLSTNAISVSNRAIDFIRKNNIEIIQVSLDGASSKLNDKIRGVNGAFTKSISGIKKLSKFSKIILNIVVSKLNQHEIEDIIKLGKKLGVDSFKFYPQKSVGRASRKRDIILSHTQWASIPFNELKSKHDVKIDYLETGSNCGAGFSGFAINENGDLFPCIFGVHNNKIKIGSVLDEDIEDMWFNSDRMNEFRMQSPIQPCNRCEC